MNVNEWLRAVAGTFVVASVALGYFLEQPWLLRVHRVRGAQPAAVGLHPVVPDDGRSCAGWASGSSAVKLLMLIVDEREEGAARGASSTAPAWSGTPSSPGGRRRVRPDGGSARGRFPRPRRSSSRCSSDEALDAARERDQALLRGLRGASEDDRLGCRGDHCEPSVADATCHPSTAGEPEMSPRRRTPQPLDHSQEWSYIAEWLYLCGGRVRATCIGSASGDASRIGSRQWPIRCACASSTSAGRRALRHRHPRPRSAGVRPTCPSTCPCSGGPDWSSAGARASTSTTGSRIPRSS